MSKRYYPESVRAALHVMSGGGCYRPECGEPAVRFVDGLPEINFEIAHIHALKAGGPREIKTMTLAQRNHISNLILLCVPCHKRVDADEVVYPATMLKQWKSSRESQPLGSLAGLRDFDAAAMQEMLDRAMAAIRQDMTSLADELPELAELLRSTLEGLPSLDPESLQLLSHTASRLDLPEYAPLMSFAAARLDLPDYAPIMHTSARALELPDYAPMLVQAARSLELPDYAPMLTEAARRLDLVSQLPRLDRIADSLADTVAAMSTTVSRAESMSWTTPSGYSEPIVVRRIPPAFWKAAAIGWCGWLIVALLVFLHAKGHF